MRRSSWGVVAAVSGVGVMAPLLWWVCAEPYGDPTPADGRYRTEVVGFQEWEVILDRGRYRTYFASDLAGPERTRGAFHLQANVVSLDNGQRWYLETVKGHRVLFRQGEWKLWRKGTRPPRWGTLPEVPKASPGPTRARLFEDLFGDLPMPTAND